MEMDSPATLIYTPYAVLNLFNNSISISQSKRMACLKGLFPQGRRSAYNGYYYDTLRDESSDAQLTLIIPALIRNELQPNKTITVNGFITKRVMNSTGSTQIQLTMTDLVEQTQNKYSKDDFAKTSLLQAKAANGFKDFNNFCNAVYDKHIPKLKSYFNFPLNADSTQIWYAIFDTEAELKRVRNGSVFFLKRTLNVIAQSFSVLHLSRARSK